MREVGSKDECEIALRHLLEYPVAVLKNLHKIYREVALQKTNCGDLESL
jgi:hypothetical protein